MGLFCRIRSLLQGSFAKETYNFREPNKRSHPIPQIRVGVCEFGVCVKMVCLCLHRACMCAWCVYVWMWCCGAYAMCVILECMCIYSVCVCEFGVRVHVLCMRLRI